VGLLGDRFRISYVPSTKILDLCQQRQQATPATLGIVENTTGDLPYTPLECEWVAQTWQVAATNRLEGAAATPDTYFQLLERVQALLSSHHATSRADNPLASYLLLANGQQVTLRDLLSPLWRFPQLLEVFLSCCETGLSFAAYRDEQGALNRDALDEPLSIGTGFLIAGARSVISSHWAVSDLATSLFSREYHQARKAGHDRLSALHTARTVLRTRTQQEWLNQLEDDYEQVSDDRKEIRTQKRTQIAKIRGWLEKNFAATDIPFQDQRYWGAFHCLGLP
jgi:CHAT domain-containing protein